MAFGPVDPNEHFQPGALGLSTKFVVVGNHALGVFTTTACIFGDPPVAQKHRPRNASPLSPVQFCSKFFVLGQNVVFV